MPTIKVVTRLSLLRRGQAPPPGPRPRLLAALATAAALVAAPVAAPALAAGAALPGAPPSAAPAVLLAATAAASPDTTTTDPGATTTSAPGAPTTTATAPAPTTTTSTTTPGPTTTIGGVNVPNAAGLGLEVPTDEATLLALVDEVHGRLVALAVQIASLNSQLSQNDVALHAAASILVSRQNDLYQAERRVDSLQAATAAARADMRERAVAAYLHQPTDDLANMFLHLQTPTDLLDARSFYRTLVDVQKSAIANYERLTKEAKSAVKKAASARDLAQRQQDAVSQQRQSLDAVKKTLEAAQSQSQEQAAEQARLLAQVGQNAAKFQSEIAAQVAESNNIEQLLASSGVVANLPSVPTGSGFFAFPVPGAPVTQPFGPNYDPFTGASGFHPGIDFGASAGTPIHAAGDGTVVYASVESGYGNYTCINHGNGIATCYAHQSVILVKVGDQVKRGQVIGLVGTTGYSTGPHLHFEVRINGQVTNPLPWLVGSKQP
ncbi:MAG TPA: peptidoglycan DD-metalloendopeptidase family protein [Acidimicrobiales bacterium]|nr:peptidoglycan DD-metalloendopeptidase family protein [Acidimicrobiales bacterium]